MKKLLLGLFLIAFATIFIGGNALAISYTFPDTISNFPGYFINPADAIGTPHVGDMTVTVNDTTGLLETVEIYMEYRRTWDTLFINTGFTKAEKWHEWDYLVRDTTTPDLGAGSSISQGLYSVASTFTTADYTLSPAGRKNHPNGIDASKLSLIDGSLIPSVGEGNPEGGGGTIVYDFTGQNIFVGDTFLIAYSPWCSNDVSSGTPVPEPATMLLGGLGLLGMGICLRKRSKRT